MRRVVCREFGPPDGLVLAEAPDPEPGPGQVVVGVRAAGVSFVDGLMDGGLYQVKPPLPFTPGLTAAGEVLGTGDGVPGLPRDSRVVGSWFGLGGYATHWLVPASTVVRLPDSVPPPRQGASPWNLRTMSRSRRPRSASLVRRANS